MKGNAVIFTVDNRLTIDGIDCGYLAEKYGTPLMVVSREHIASKCLEIKKAFLDKYKNVGVAYAGKAFLNMAMCKIVEEEGLNLDVVSGGELYTAIKAGFPTGRIEFNGNNKSQQELEMAIDNGVGRIIIDSYDEISIIEETCKKLKKQVNVLIRISPGVDSHTHQYVTTGNLDSKFGLPMDGEHIERTIDISLKSEHVNLLGFHFHIGSQLHEIEPYMMATDILLKRIDLLEKRFPLLDVREINIGGGFGIRYTEEDNNKPFDYFVQPVMNQIEEYYLSSKKDRPRVMIEPGRSIIAGAGVTLYTVGSIKEIPGVRKYVAVDGGMTDNIRPALYNSKYECWLGSKLPEMGNKEKAQEELFTICGKCCESGDILLEDVKLPMPTRGDLLAIFNTGAYCYSMASNYNKIPFLPVVMIKDGKDVTMVRRQSYEELVERDCVF